MDETHEEVKNIHIIGADTREWLVDGAVCQGLRQVGIRLVGVSFARPPFEFSRVNWPCAQILACCGGHGEVMVGDQWLPCRQGWAYLNGPNQYSAYRAVGRVPWELCWVMYDLPQRQCPVVSPKPALVQADTRGLRAAIEGLYRESLDRGEFVCMDAWASLVERYAMRICQGGSAGRLWSVWQKIQDQLGRSWTLDKMAGLAHMSGEHFRRLCHEEMGRSPMKHLTRIRMRHAAGLLTSSELTIDAVAQAVGYNDRFGFSMAFKKELGCSPGAFRKNQPVRSDK